MHSPAEAEALNPYGLRFKKSSLTSKKPVAAANNSPGPNSYQDGRYILSL